MTDAPSTATVTATDGVALAVHRYTDIDPRRPTILAIHGYPDNHHVWDRVAEQLSGRSAERGTSEDEAGGAGAPRYNVVAYDVRGAGESGEPADRSGYRFPQLVSDVNSVIDSLGVDRVHLLGHDWGSIQGWAAVTDPAVMPKVASYTSISGPHLEYAGKFLRSGRDARSLGAVAKQLAASGYIGFFLTPKAPEAFFDSTWGPRLLNNLERIGRSGRDSRPASSLRTKRDYLNGLNLYRANMPAPMARPSAQLPPTTVPVQVLIPRKDVFVTPALQRFTGAIADGGRIVPIEGGHWVVTDEPEVIARLTTEWVDAMDQDVARS